VGSGATVEEKVARSRVQTVEPPRLNLTHDQVAGRYMGEMKAAPVTPKPSVEDEASKRPAIEFKAADAEIEPAPDDRGYADDGVDPDPDDNDYSQPKVNGRNSNPGSRSSGGGGDKPGAAEPAAENVSIITRVRRLFGRS
jgi:hypothetical protein